MVALAEQLTRRADVHRDPDGRRTGPAELLRPITRAQIVPLGPAAAHREQRRGLGEAVDLDELPPELGLDTLDDRRGRRRFDRWGVGVA